MADLSSYNLTTIVNIDASTTTTTYIDCIVSSISVSIDHYNFRNCIIGQITTGITISDSVFDNVMFSQIITDVTFTKCVMNNVTFQNQIMKNTASPSITGSLTNVNFVSVTYYSFYSAMESSTFRYVKFFENISYVNFDRSINLADVKFMKMVGRCDFLTNGVCAFLNAAGSRTKFVLVRGLFDGSSNTVDATAVSNAVFNWNDAVINTALTQVTIDPFNLKSSYTFCEIDNNFTAITLAPCEFTNCKFTGTFTGTDVSYCKFTDCTFTNTVANVKFATAGTAGGMATETFDGAAGICGNGATLTRVKFDCNVTGCTFAGVGGNGGKQASSGTKRSGTGGNGGFAKLTNVTFTKNVQNCVFAAISGRNGILDLTGSSTAFAGDLGAGGSVDMTTTIFTSTVDRSLTGLKFSAYDPISGTVESKMINGTGSTIHINFAMTYDQLTLANPFPTGNIFPTGTDSLSPYWRYVQPPPTQNNGGGSGTGGPVPPPANNAACFDFHTMMVLSRFLPKRKMVIMGPRRDSHGVPKPMKQAFMFIRNQWEVVAFTVDHPFIVKNSIKNDIDESESVSILDFATLCNTVNSHVVPIRDLSDDESSMVYNVVIDEPLELSPELAMLGASDCNVAHLRQPFINLRLRVLDEHGLRFFIRW